MNCEGCGSTLEVSEEQVNSTVDQILSTSLEDAKKRGGVCPLCGHSKQVPYSHRKTVLFALLLACLSVGTLLVVRNVHKEETDRSGAARDALRQISTNAHVFDMLGSPITMGKEVEGYVRQDETGWQETRLTFSVHGPKGTGIAHAVGGRASGTWTFTTFEVEFETQRKKLDLVSGRIVEYDPSAYVDVHVQSATEPEYLTAVAAAPRMDGHFPCVSASVAEGEITPQLSSCSMPTLSLGPVDRVEADLRYGSFVLRETDLFIEDVFKIPLTRTYASNDWVHSSQIHAFGRNTNHPYDIAPVGTRNPYTFQMIVLEDGDFLYFDRISKGSGYRDAVYRHTETSTRFYKATQRWNGNGWTMKLSDGSEILFPESYNAKNAAQGAPTEMRDAQGHRLELHRDPQRNLVEIKTPHGRWIHFTYDDLGRIKHAEDDAGHWAKYEYNSDGMLDEAELSSGRERHYQYEGHRMTQITDEHGNVLLQNFYTHQGVLREQKFRSGADYQYDYEWSDNRDYVKKAWVTSGSQTRQVDPADSVPEYIRNYHQ